MTIAYKKKKNAVIIFQDGSYFEGYGIGSYGITKGEICFNTSMTGYQEILTDPSYNQQIINFTFPHIGNVGVNFDDIESKKILVAGLIIRESITSQSNYRAKDNFNNWLKEKKLIGISGIDTRKITKIIKKNGASFVSIIHDENINNDIIKSAFENLKSSKDLNGVELASISSDNKTYSWGDEGKWHHKNQSYNSIKNKKHKVVAIDYGAKLNILRCLTEIGLDVVVVGAKTSFAEIMSHKPDGVFLSNGPGDPSETGKYAIATIQEILKNNIPLFGICLGHQLLALSLGAKTIKMQQGHRGVNHPTQNLKNKKVEITSQNHGFCVDRNSLPQNIEITHISLFDNSIEGIRVKDKPAFSVQYHPESSAGPSDSFYLFEEFAQMMDKNNKI